MIDKVRGGLRHVPAIAGRANPAPLARERDDKPLAAARAERKRLSVPRVEESLALLKAGHGNPASGRGLGCLALPRRSRTERRLVEKSNGCTCSLLQEDLLQQVASLAREGRFDYLLVESASISKPLPVANTFTFADEQGESLSSPARLDKLITVVDSKNILADSAICQVFIAITWLNTSETGGPPSRMQP